MPYKEMSKSKSKTKMIMHHDEISMFMSQHRVLLRRYMALTPKAIVIYKDQASFVTHPTKPWMIIPLSDITDVKMHQASDRKELAIEFESDRSDEK